jgi:hypothetical protein
VHDTEPPIYAVPGEILPVKSKKATRPRGLEAIWRVGVADDAWAVFRKAGELTLEADHRASGGDVKAQFVLPTAVALPPSPTEIVLGPVAASP